MSVEAKKLVVLGIPWDVDTERLRQYMSQFGELVDVMVMKDRASGRSRGFGYVTFTFSEDAEKVLVAQHMINGRTLEVKVATPKEEMMPTSRASSRVFVARIPPSVTDEYFHSYFMKYGPIIDAYMPKDPGTKQHRGIGFVTYENPGSVDQLMSETHELKGSAVAVDCATPKGGCKRHRVSSRYLRMPQTSRTANTVDYNAVDCNSRMAISERQPSNLLISSVQPAAESMVPGFVAAGDANSVMLSSGQATDPAPIRRGKRLFIGRVPTETTSGDLHAYFSQFGWVLDVYLPKDAKRISHRGFGFVTFADEASVVRVARCRHFLHGREIAIDAASPADNAHVTGQIPMNRLLSYGSKDDLSLDVMAGAATEEDFSARPSTSSNVKWGKRLFIGRIPIEATVADVQLHFSQFSQIVDVYLPKAKRDPYRFRFPIEMRFVDPNIDHLIFNRFDFPPIFHRDEDTNPDEIRRDCGRPPIPIKDPGIKVAEEPLLSNHPYVDKLWQIHVTEQMILDDMETNPDKYKDKKLTELTDDDDFDEENSVEYTKAYYKKTLLPKMILKTSIKELDLEAALAERQLHNQLRKEAKERGEKYKVTKMRRNTEMDEYDFIHWRRSFEEREALIRDISCRQALGLPLEEPGRYVDASYFGKDQYDPESPLYRYDYWGEPKNSEKSRQERMTDAHNKSIVGKGTVWYEMSYEDAIKQQMQREAQSKGATQKEADNEEYDERDPDDKDDDYDDDEEEEDFDYSILGDPSMSFSNPPLVNGTESRLSDDGMFEN